MNRTGIEWTDFTWNPIVGCNHGCDYCYARRMAERGLGEYGEHPKDERFKPRFLPERLDQPRHRKKSAKIFVCSMADMFGEWVPDKWIEKVLAVARNNKQHTFQFLTKNPARYDEFNFPDNCWLGTSVDGTDFKTDMKRTDIMYYIEADVKFLSIEPLLGNVEDHITLAPFNWVIIGAQTGPGAKKPERWWVDQIFRNYNGPMFLKDNLDWSEEIQEFPEIGGISDELT